MRAFVLVARVVEALVVLAAVLIAPVVAVVLFIVGETDYAWVWCGVFAMGLLFGALILFDVVGRRRAKQAGD